MSIKFSRRKMLLAGGLTFLPAIAMAQPATTKNALIELVDANQVYTVNHARYEMCTFEFSENSSYIFFASCDFIECAFMGLHLVKPNAHVNFYACQFVRCDVKNHSAIAKGIIQESILD